jgi:hypothetical protein
MYGASASFSLLSSQEVGIPPCAITTDFDLYTLPPDTPWDEPTHRSPEFRMYLSGAIFQESPWSRLGQEALCKSASTDIALAHMS